MIILIAFFDDEIFVYRCGRLRKYPTNWIRSARMMRTITGDKRTFKAFVETWCEKYRIY